MHARTVAFLKLSAAMMIFGSIGAFVRSIPLPSSVIAFVRAAVGCLFLLVLLLAGRKRFTQHFGVGQLRKLLLSGTALGLNWVFLFESYRFTSVAVATVCYYMAPILVVFLSPLLLKEKLSIKKVICICCAVLGMAFVSGVLTGGSQASGEGKGILFGLTAAVLYASVMLLNKRISGIASFERTVIQLAVSAVILLIYNLINGEFRDIPLDVPTLARLLTVGVIHTGIAYYLYFGSMDGLSGQSIAIASYIDPVVAVLVSVVLLNEPLSISDTAGAVMIIGAAIVSEVPIGRKELQK